MREIDYPFVTKAARIINARQSNSVVLAGNIHDLFHVSSASGPGTYMPLVDFLIERWSPRESAGASDDRGVMVIVYELNGPIRFVGEKDRKKLKDAWLRWQTGMDEDQILIQQMIRRSRVESMAEQVGKNFDANIEGAVGQPTMALEMLRQLCICSRSTVGSGQALKENLLIIIEGADLLIPEGAVPTLSDADRHRINICHDWFSDPGFMLAGDAVVLLAESRSGLNRRIATLPSIVEVDVPFPDEAVRKHFISWFRATSGAGDKLKTWGTDDDLAQASAGLSIHVLRHLLAGAVYENREITVGDVVDKVEEHFQSQLGEEMVEFKRPAHTLEDVVGYGKLKKFLREEMIPRLKSTGRDALPGAAVCGPIGSGKTFIFEAVAAEAGVPVLVLKSIRSKWFGETDLLFERLRRVIESLSKVLVFVDEADTQFSGVSKEMHETERRLTGKIQAMMSDARLRGKVTWLLMTARINLLSPDIRRPGRVGDLIVPVLDPEGEERREFLKWMIKPAFESEIPDALIDEILPITEGYSSASYASIRSELTSRAKLLGKKYLDKTDIIETIKDRIPPDIEDTRRYQTLQALTNCTRRSLLPDGTDVEKQKKGWFEEMRILEAKGLA